MDFMNQTNQMDHTHPMSPCMPHSPSADQKEECSWQTPGMAYVPWQNFTKVYDPKKALQAADESKGTLRMDCNTRVLCGGYDALP